MADIGEMLQQIFIIPLSEFFSKSVSLLPKLLIVLVFLALIYIGAYIVGLAVKNVLHRIRIDRLLRAEDRKDTFGATSLAPIFGSAAKWSLFAVFAGRLFEAIDLGFLSPFAQLLMFWLTKLVLAAIVIAVGIVIIDFFTLRIISRDKLFSGAIRIVRAFLIIVLAFTAIEQFGLKFSLAENIILLITAAALFAAALALGIGFGLAIRDEAKDFLRKFLRLAEKQEKRK
ncbi:MAG: hypothetical protein HYX24_06300 [Candidatus Aenigmarchaeota archaeon]|nr:hypothetical protein [Candidatus Aenigmarchaeota archaeon]